MSNENGIEIRELTSEEAIQALVCSAWPAYAARPKEWFDAHDVLQIAALQSATFDYIMARELRLWAGVALRRASIACDEIPGIIWSLQP